MFFVKFITAGFLQKNWKRIFVTEKRCLCLCLCLQRPHISHNQIRLEKFTSPVREGTPCPLSDVQCQPPHISLCCPLRLLGLAQQSVFIFFRQIWIPILIGSWKPRNTKSNNIRFLKTTQYEQNSDQKVWSITNTNSIRSRNSGQIRTQITM